ncbi:alpha/beta fold hydrolase [Novosphingobium tardum]|uniref:Alpha/beta fold hydrolase n=1 Tax=Novosphingobium tardum TaxID=1538021 RepID=A0ABV8RQU7_9SPHN
MADTEPRLSMKVVMGRRLRVAEWRPELAESGAVPLLMFNGIGINLELMAPIAQDLAERPVVLFDMPGIGKSPDPVVPYTPVTMAMTANALLDRLGFGEVDVLGISWGGGIAQQFALQHRSRINRLVLAATSAGMTMAPGDLRTVKRLLDPREYTLPRTLERNLAMMFNGGGTGPAVSLNAVTPPSPVGWLYQLGAVMGWTSVPMLPLLDVPTLIMAGAQDQVVPPINAQFLHGLIRGSRLKTFSGGGHLFMLSQREKFVNELRAFLDEEKVGLAA